MCQSFHSKAVVCNGSRAVVAELSCKCWNCPDCGPRRLAAWRSRIEALAGMDTDFERTVCRTRLEYRALVARLRRAGCEFVKATTDEGWEVFHQAFRGNRQTEAEPSRWMDGAAMLAAAECALGRLRHSPEIRCMTASAGVPRPEKSDAPRWQVLARTRLTFDELNRRVKSAGWDRLILPGRLFPVRLVESLVGSGFQLCSQVSAVWNSFLEKSQLATTRMPGLVSVATM